MHLPKHNGFLNKKVGEILRPFLMFSMIVYKIQNRHGDDQEVPQKAQGIGDLSEQEKADDCRENDLRVVIDTDLTGRGVGVGGGDGKLTACAAQTTADEHAQLIGCGQHKLRSHQWKYGNAGEAGEEQHDHGTEGTALCGTAQTGISATCGNAAQQTDQRGKQLQVFPCGFDDEQCSEEGTHNGKNLEGTNFFLQQVRGKQNGKEGTELIEHIGVCQIQTVDGIKVCHKTDGAQNSTCQHIFEIVFPDVQGCMISF